MSAVVYSRRAQREINSIQRKLAREAGPHTALKWARRLRHAADALCELPDRGAVDTQIERRRLVVAPYLIFYEVRPDNQVLVAAVVDGRRDLPKLFRDAGSL